MHVNQTRKELIELKGAAYPEIDLAHIFNQLYVDGDLSLVALVSQKGKFDSYGLSGLICSSC